MKTLVGVPYQEIFDVAVGGVIKQGKPALSDDGDCYYRAPDGCKCAVGQLIDDADYSPEDEGNNVSSLFKGETHVRFFGPSETDEEEETKNHLIFFLRAVQSAHDSWLTVDQESPEERIEFIPFFKERVMWVATEYGLNTNVFEGG